MKHIKPMPGFLVAKLVKKELKSGIILPDGDKPVKSHSDIVIEAVHPDDQKEHPELKKGAIIFVLPNSLSPQLQSPEHGNPAIIPINDIMGYEA